MKMSFFFFANLNELCATQQTDFPKHWEQEQLQKYNLTS